jgi:hypothetical protein
MVLAMTLGQADLLAARFAFYYVVASQSHLMIQTPAIPQYRMEMHRKYGIPFRRSNASDSVPAGKMRVPAHETLIKGRSLFPALWPV